MSGYELRAEHRPAEVGRAVRRWHIAQAHRLKGWCGRLLDPVADVLPITHAPRVEPRLRCRDCWHLLVHGPAAADLGIHRPVHAGEGTDARAQVGGESLPVGAPVDDAGSR